MMDQSKLQIYQSDENSAAAKLQSIRDRMREKYAARIAAAGPLRRAFLHWRMRHEIETEIAKAAQSIAARL